MGSFTFSGEKFEDFSRIFQDPTLSYLNLASTKQNVSIETYVHLQKCQTRRAWKHVQTRHSLCISCSMDMCERNERAMEKNTSVFTHFCKNFEHFIFCIPEHLFSFTLKIMSVDIFRLCSVKKIKVIWGRKPISSTFNAVKSDSWNPRVNSRRILTLKWTY